MQNITFDSGVKYNKFLTGFKKKSLKFTNVVPVVSTEHRIQCHAQRKSSVRFTQNSYAWLLALYVSVLCKDY